jgi:hypothetical protein
MPLPGNQVPENQLPGREAVAHRSRLLSRTRTISLGIAGGAAVASLGLGTAFAHAIPGHKHPAGAQSAAGSSSGTGRPAVPAPSAQPSRSAGPARTHRSHHPQRLTPPPQPPQPPASTPAPPQVSSGAS